MFSLLEPCLLSIWLFLATSCFSQDVIWYSPMNSSITGEWAQTGTVTALLSPSGICPDSANGNDYCWSITTTGSLIRGPVSTEGYQNVQLIYSGKGTNINGPDRCFIEYTTDGTLTFVEQVNVWSSNSEVIDQIFPSFINGDDNTNGIAIRLRSNRDAMECYFNELRLEGNLITPQPTTNTPTTSTPTTNAPTTDVPTTIAPTTSTPTTSAPVTNQPTSMPVTTEPTTSIPTVIPGTPTSAPVTNMPTTMIPTTSIPTIIPGSPTKTPVTSIPVLTPTNYPSLEPTLEPTFYPTMEPVTVQSTTLDDQSTAIATKDTDDNDDGNLKEDLMDELQNINLIRIIVVGLIVIYILICLFIWCKERRKRHKELLLLKNDPEIRAEYLRDRSRQRADKTQKMDTQIQMSTGDDVDRYYE